MNPLAVELNEIIEAHSPAVMRMLSELGKGLYFPKGILTQSAEAKGKATRHNATIGEARESGHSMALGSIMRHLCGLEADDVLPYASSYGRAELRAAWKDKICDKNPSLASTPISLPVVAAGITSGLSTVADMFLDPGDVILMPDKLWGNYLMVFALRRGATVVRYPLLDLDHGFDVQGFRQTVQENAGAGKVNILFNFPNNPTGYSITPAEADQIREILISVAEEGCDVVAICDDAYFGLFYGEQVLHESLFTRLADAHPRVMAVKLDGASKEDYAWGLRVAFITYGMLDASGVYAALEKKTAGCVRATISNTSNLSQELLLRAMSDPAYQTEKAERAAVLTQRAATATKILSDSRFDKAWRLYPFNAGYFLCLRLNDLDAEAYRVRLLHEYGVGVIATSSTDIRVAISCVDEPDLLDLFDTMLACAEEMVAED
ncbi:MAG: aminotransferase class I/II-fold pyridoxal phosphate-dependent enzyme [Thermoleophilia bacterium]|jgi:aspartate/methionine/tyrosine aminotransferase